MFVLAIGTGDRDGEGIAGTAVGPGAECREDRASGSARTRQPSPTGWPSTGSRPSTARSTPQRAGSNRSACSACRGRARRSLRWPQAVGLSKTTVRHWLRRYGLKTLNGRATLQAILGSRRDEAAASWPCSMPAPRTERPSSCSRAVATTAASNVASRRSTRRRRKIKAMLVAEAGGWLPVCGYDRHPRALEFHHLDPPTSGWQISGNGVHSIARHAAGRGEEVRAALLELPRRDRGRGQRAVPLQFRRNARGSE